MTDPVKSRGFDVPAAASLLTIYEYTATTSQTGWLEHLRGIATLFELKGPSFFHKHPARALFIFIRMSIVFATVIWRERSYLERSEWQDFLIAAEDEEETLQGIRIVNLLARVSGLIQGMLQPHNNPQSDWSSILDDLADWHQTWSRCLPACLPRSVPAGSSTEHTVLRKILWYTRLNVAAAFCQYHAAIILVHKWSHRSATQDSAMEPHPATVQEHALSICQSIPYLLAEEHSHLGAFYLLFPAYVACQALNPEQAERQWLAGILAQVARDKGIAIAKNLVHKLEEGQMGGKE
ncbi:hypothetical protein H2200_007506 [Cladophialophora chaetospira]|uniref:Uncharacterized protein n=1 Tax=Cladophialophora chaetospira TaxID=386627 RepID=A0AA39CHQ8_9EURO|nr:hypothetical protein H2200_007506 [Cladophialophora chaetospira]